MKQLTIWKSIYNDIMLKMSQTRNNAYKKIANYMIQLLVHLMNVEQYGKKSEYYNHWMKEITGFKKIIQKANQKKNTNKKWFDTEFIVNVSEDSIDEAKLLFYKKWKVDFKKNYESIVDFKWFNLFD